MRTLVLLAAVLVAPSASPCKCRPPPPPDQALAQAAAVFTGTVAKAERVTKDGKRSDFSVRDLTAAEEESQPSEDRYEVTFAVDRSWKGVGAPTVVLTSRLPVCCLCLTAFEKGQQWLIYAERKPDGTLLGGSCSRTTLLKLADADLKALGKPEKTFPAK